MNANDGRGAFVKTIQEIFPPIRPILRPVLYGCGIASLTLLLAIHQSKPTSLIVAFSFPVFTTIGALVGLFQARKQFRKEQSSMLSSNSSCSSQWASLAASDRATLVCLWALFLGTWLVGGIGPYVVGKVAYAYGRRSVEPAVAASSSSSSATAIERVLTNAERVCKQVQREQNAISTSKALRMLAEGYDKIDLRGCPSDFQVAFLSYTTAIDHMIPFSAKYDDFSLYNLFVNTADFASQGPKRVNELTDQGDRLRQAIMLARQKVKEVGLRHNANVTYDF